MSSIDSSSDEFTEDIFETLINTLSEYGDKSLWYLSISNQDNFYSQWGKVDYLRKENNKSINEVIKEKESFG